MPPMEKSIIDRLICPFSKIDDGFGAKNDDDDETGTSSMFSWETGDPFEGMVLEPGDNFWK